ncbi:MAG: dTDP-4-dehydrorhamnose 3,5-epimerase [Desulfopila sp.]|jgi:dTDP-4-dehydrorhamnose 3,5-epimerase|nr:dTDP-4-dehydrorhamnose 3,5-epimerase [Desulfopila sp.]
MRVTPTAIHDVLIAEPKVFGDERGFFYESFNQQTWQEITGLPGKFVQSNHSRSLRGVLRGIHYQIRQPQGKLVRVVVGEVFDVAVDLRRSSPTFGQWVGEYISAENKKQIWIPEGFGHGFLVMSDVAETLYRTTNYYAPEHERCILWNDPDIAVDWPIEGKPLLSGKDVAGKLLKDADVYR